MGSSLLYFLPNITVLPSFACWLVLRLAWGGLNEVCPISLGHLGGLVGVALLQEACHREPDLRFQKSQALASSLWFEI